MQTILNEPHHRRAERKIWQMELDFVRQEIDFFAKALAQKAAACAAEPDDPVAARLTEQLPLFREWVNRLAVQIRQLDPPPTVADATSADELRDDDARLLAQQQLRPEVHRFEHEYHTLKQTMRAYVASYSTVS